MTLLWQEASLSTKPTSACNFDVAQGEKKKSSRGALILKLADFAS